MSARTSPARVAFFTEDHIGHSTFSATLHDEVERRGDLQAVWCPLRPDTAARGLAAHAPLARNWSLQASWYARGILERLHPAPDALFFHTPVAALLSVSHMRRIPTVLSTDATPENLDSVAGAYAHDVSSNGIERLKRGIVRRAYGAARAVVLWSGWAESSTLRDYGVAADRTLVIPPGVDLAALHPAGRERTADEALRILFVGGDLERKGGADLLRALDGAPFAWHLDAVTAGAQPPHSGVTWHTDVAPRSPELYRLFQEADVFALPTRGEAFGIVVAEAMAAGLPVVAAAVGALPELVAHEQTGLLTAPRDVTGLRDALTRLAADPAQRAAYGARARVEAEARFDDHVNAARIIDLVLSVA